MQPYLSQPYLSIVAPSRNDDHGGDLLKRMQAFVTALREQCKRHKLDSELILVEWNPPADRPRLAEALRWSNDPTPCSVRRIIEVPEAIHKRYRHADGLGLYQMIAKNVGIRRAQGQFVLATNIDLIFSDELMQFIAARSLERNRMYRIDRSDVMTGIPDAPVEEQLEWCGTHMIRIHSASGTSTVTPDGDFTFEDQDIAARDSGLKLGAGWFARELHGTTPFRWFDNHAEIDIEMSGRFLAMDVAPGPGLRGGGTALEVLDKEKRIFSTRISARRVVHIPLSETPIRLKLRIAEGGAKVEGEPRALNIQVRRMALVQAAAPFEAMKNVYWAARNRVGRMVYPAPKYAEVPPDFLHLQACGDFTMMARERWIDLRGYPEFDMFPMNLDSVLCWAAHYGGAKEQVLHAPMRAFHIDHEKGSGGRPEGQAELFRKLKEKGVPWLDQTEMLRLGFEMCRTNSPKIFNGEDWGLGTEEFKETLRG